MRVTATIEHVGFAGRSGPVLTAVEIGKPEDGGSSSGDGGNARKRNVGEEIGGDGILGDDNPTEDGLRREAPTRGRVWRRMLAIQACWEIDDRPSKKVLVSASRGPLSEFKVIVNVIC